MRKLISLLLVVIMLMTFCACGKKKSEEKLLSDSLSVKLENVWTTFLEAEGAMQSAVIWACDYAVAYCDNPCRDNYIRAIAAATAASEFTEKLILGECILTDEDYADFLECGYDLSYIASDYSSFAENARVNALFCRTMALDLLTEAFWEYGIEYVKKNAEVHKNIAKLQIDIAANRTNEVMLLSGKDSYSKELYERAPAVINSETPFINQQSKVDETNDRYLDEYEAQLDFFSELESIQLANTAVFEKAVQNGDYSEIFAKGLIWDEIYAVLNLPEFTMQKTEAVYLDEAGVECTISPGDDLSKIKPILSVQFCQADKTGFRDYLQSMPVKAENFSVAGSLEGEADCYVSYNDGVICFDALWKSSVLTVTVYDSVSVLCPYWYMYYKLT